MNIIKKTSTNNTGSYQGRPIDFLVIHYTAGTTSKTGTAKNVAAMFANPNSRAASADFIVDDTDIVQYNPDIKNRYCYAVGGNLQNTYGGKYFGKCKNYNSVSIEICSYNTTGKVVNDFNSNTWQFTNASVNNAVELARYLMKTYNIKNLVTHFEVNAKPCPNLIGWNTYKGNNDAKWQEFKRKVFAVQESKKDVVEMDIDKFINDLTNEQAYLILQKARRYMAGLTAPEWSVDSINKAVEKQITDGKRPCDLITRAEAVTMIERAVKD